MILKVRLQFGEKHPRKASMTMKRMRVAAAILVTASLALGGSAEEGAEREIRDLEAGFGRAVIQGDRAFFERALADDFTHTSHSGAFKTRAQWMAEAKAGDRATEPRQGQTRYDSYDIDDLAVRFYGDTAVVTGRTTPRGRNSQGQPISGQFRYLRVWVKRQGRWQAVAFQGTRIMAP